MISEQEFIKLLQKNDHEGCTDEEKLFMDEYIKANLISSDVNYKLIDDTLIDHTLDKIRTRVDAYENYRTKQRTALGLIVKIAASFILLCSVTLLLSHNKQSIYNYISPVSYTSIEAKTGKNIAIDLPDGSAVLLNQNSKLIYSNRFNQRLREVTLIGEAYFKVAKDKSRPFIVHTGNVSTKVLGTSFNIEAYLSTKRIAVELITGKVWLSVNAPKSNINYILNPNQIVTYDVITGLAEKKNVMDAASYAEWKDGKIKFSDTPMDEVIKRIEITYQCQVTLTDKKLESQHIFGEFGITEKPTNVIRAICALVKAKYQVKPNGKIVINPN